MIYESHDIYELKLSGGGWRTAGGMEGKGENQTFCQTVFQQYHSFQELGFEGLAVMSLRGAEGGRVLAEVPQ